MSSKIDEKQVALDESSKLSFPASDPPPWNTAGEHELKKCSDGAKLVLPEDFLQQVKQKLLVNEVEYNYYSLPVAQKYGLEGLSRLPFTLKILLENLLRHQIDTTVTINSIKALVGWLEYASSNQEIAYYPARVLMQDFTGVPAIVDLAAMRTVIQELGGDPKRINPFIPIDLVIDHSVQVDKFLVPEAFAINAQLEMERNYERYEFLRWGQKAFQNFRVVPPDAGICHQINLEYLAQVVWTQTVEGEIYAYPDTLVGTDSHTTMINGLGVLGWGVGGIEAEAAMLGQPISMIIPEVTGVKLIGKLSEGVTATDLVLTITQLLRQQGVVGKFVEFFGDGISCLSIADRATISNMAPEYGATCGFFPVDKATLDYLRLTNRNIQAVALVEAYSKAQGLWYDPSQPEPVFTKVLTLDLTAIKPCIAGPKRPQDRIELNQVNINFNALLTQINREQEKNTAYPTNDDYAVHHGDVVIASITSCTNTSNPNVLIAAGLVAKKAVEKGLTRKPWVKTSFAPGSQAVTYYLQEAGLQKYLDTLGFSLVGYGCTTCIGNSGPLIKPVEKAILDNDLLVSAVLSGNRNFEGRIHPLVKANYLASPPLVIAFALTGTILINLLTEPLGKDKNGKLVYLKDLWPSNAEISNQLTKVTSKMFSMAYANIFTGSKAWQAMSIPTSQSYTWRFDSTYIRYPPFFEQMTVTPKKLASIKEAKILAIFGDSITTDHISPAGSIKPNSPAGRYLQLQGVLVQDFNSYGSRRGNHEVMVRGTFANIRLRNEMVPGIEGGFTRCAFSDEVLPIYDAAMLYREKNVPLVIIAGKEYGTGSSRDWAAKGPKLLGIQAVIAESFERIHRSNLIGVGILPLQFTNGDSRKTLQLTGLETIEIALIDDLKPREIIKVMINREDGFQTVINALVCIDTLNELNYYKHGGVLQYVLRNRVRLESS